jgi:RNA polymerase sigma-70 factor (sigma-E family)
MSEPQTQIDRPCVYQGVAHDRKAKLDADFTEFVEANAHRIRSLAEWLSGDPNQAADLAQSALERTYVRWPHIQSSDPMAYVRKALLNQQRDRWRRRKLRPEWPTDAVPDVSTHDDHAVGHAQRDLVLAAMARLTRRERHVLVLRYYADLADSDIAAEVGVAVGTVKSTLARALRKMRVQFESIDATDLTASGRRSANSEVNYEMG